MYILDALYSLKQLITLILKIIPSRSIWQAIGYRIYSKRQSIIGMFHVWGTKHAENGAGSCSLSLLLKSDRLSSGIQSCSPETDPVLYLEKPGLPSMSSHIWVGVYLVLKIANSSQTWVSGTWYLFRRNQQRVLLLDWKLIHSIFHHKYNAPGENTAAKPDRQIRRGPSTQYSAWYTVASYVLIERYTSDDRGEVVEVTINYVP